MKCIICGVRMRDYVDKNGKNVKGFEFKMLADNIDFYGKTHKDCFLSSDSPIVLQNLATFSDLDQLKGREVNVEWDVETYGQKQVKRLISFELGDKFFDLVERIPDKDKKKES